MAIARNQNNGAIEALSSFCNLYSVALLQKLDVNSPVRSAVVQHGPSILLALDKS